MKYSPIDELIFKSPNKFMLTNAIAGRAKQILEGSLPYVSDFDPASPINTALKELLSEKIKYRISSEPIKVKEKEKAEEAGKSLENLAKEETKKGKKKK